MQPTPRSNRPARAAERGMVLWMTMLIVLMLGGLSTAFLWEGLGEKTAVEHRRTTLLALEICEMGAISSTMEITSLEDSTTDGVGNVTRPFAGGDFESVAVQNPNFPDRWRITTRGTYRLSTKRIEIGVRRRERSEWVEGLFAKDDLTFNGDVRTDSFDSRLGTYASQATNNDAGGPHAGTRGHIGSNATIRVTGSAMHVRGNAIPGPLSPIEASGTPTILGDTLPRRAEVPLPEVPQSEFEAALATNDNAGILVAGGGGKPPYTAKTYALVANGTTVVTLPGGTYFFSEVRLSGGAQLKVTGAATIYVTGQFDLGGGTFVNTTGIASNMLVYAHPYALPGGVTPSHSEVIFSGGSGSALAVYAPAVDVTVNGNSDVYGALVGRQIKSTGDAFFHYDVALGDWNKLSLVYMERLYWKDLSAPLR